MLSQKQKSQFGILGNDERNLGGRIQVVQHMKNHHKALLKVKPRLNTQKAPTKHINKRAKPSGKGKQLIKNAYEMENVVTSFKKVANMKKGYINTSKPKAMKTKKLRKPGRHANTKKFISQEHERELKSLKKRISRVGKRMNDRKKNPYDPVAHPVRFFRRDPLDPMTGKQADKMGINLDCLAGKMVGRRDVINIENKGMLDRGGKGTKQMEFTGGDGGYRGVVNKGSKIGRRIERKLNKEVEGKVGFTGIRLGSAMHKRSRSRAGTGEEEEDDHLTRE